MRYALHRIYAPRRRASPMEEGPEVSQEPVEPRAVVREISLGSNDGIRTIKLRQPNIVWRARRGGVPPGAGKC